MCKQSQIIPENDCQGDIDVCLSCKKPVCDLDLEVHRSYRNAMPKKTKRGKGK